MVKVDGKLYMVSGFDDGVVCLLEMHRMNGESLKRPIVPKKGTQSPEPIADLGVYDQWHEQAFEHADSIISVEASAPESTEAAPVRVVTASKDGTIYVWSILGDSCDPDERLFYVADYALDEPLSKVKWLTPTQILAATTHGNLYALELTKDAQNVECLSRPKLVYTTAHDVSIWDLTVFSKAPKFEVWLAEDSGKVTQLTLESNMQVAASQTVHVSSQTNSFFTFRVSSLSFSFLL